MQILDKATLWKRRVRLWWQCVLRKIDQYKIKRHAKKIVDALRKNYIKTGNVSHTLAQHDYKFDLTPALTVLCTKGAISYEYDDTVADRTYNITIEVNNEIENQ